MISLQKKEKGLITRYPIVGSRRLSNYWWSIVIFLGGCGFLFTGLSSFFERNLLLIPSPEGITKSPKLELATQLNKDKAILASNLLFFPFEKNESRSILDPPFLSFCYSSIRSNTDFVGFSDAVNRMPTKALVPNLSLPKPIDSVSSCSANIYTSSICCAQDVNEGNLPIQTLSKPFGYVHSKEGVSKTPALTNQVSTKHSFIQQDQYQRLINIYSVEMPLASVIPTGSEAGGVTSKGANIRLISIFNQVPILPFFPQGLVLSFYGFLGVTFSFHLLFALFWEVGGGFNEIDKKEKSVRIFRWGRPGKNRRIDLKYSNELMNAIKIELSPKPALFLCLKGDKKIPLTRIGELLPLEDLETQAAELTSLLQIPLEIADS